MTSNQYGPKTLAADSLHAMKYRGIGEDFREAMNRVAFALKDNDNHYHAFRDILLNQRFLPAGRIQASMGATRRTTAYNCFVSGTIEDSFVDGDGSIMGRAKQAAATMRMGGGIGYDFSTLRPRGFRVTKIDSQASGPVSFMPIFDAVCLATASYGHRRGAQMGTLRVDHPDIEEFIAAKQNNTALKGFNVSIAITDVFMKAALAGEDFDLMWDDKPLKSINAAALWEKIMRSTWDWAEPGVLFIDTINNMNNLYYCEKIAATNPCFTGDTKVWTAEGQKTFKELAKSGVSVEVLTFDDVNNKFIYRTMRNPRITGQNKKLVEVTFATHGGKHGHAKLSTVRCTPNHKFYLRDGTQVEAKDLKNGMGITSVYRYPRGKSYLSLNNHACAMMEHHVPYEGVSGFGQTVDVHHKDENKHNNRPDNLELKDHGKHSSEHIMGDNNPMRKYPDKNHFRTRDNTGANNARYRNDINDDEVKALRDSGLSMAAIAEKMGCGKYTIAKRLGYARPSNHKVVTVTEIEEREDVYCGTVDGTHSFFVALGDHDGVLVHNCGEQPLPPFGACLLGSFNLTKYLLPRFDKTWMFDYGQLAEDIPHAVRAMDNVVDRTHYPMSEQRAEAITKRRMGLGVAGLANAAEALGHPYGSPGFLQFESDVLEVIRNVSYQASAMLAQEKGAFPLYDERYLLGQFIQDLPTEIRVLIAKHGIRNSHLTSIAPTGTISMSADNISSGIEPVFSYKTTRPINTPEGQVMVEIEDYGVGFLNTRGKLSADVTAKEHVDVLTTAQKFVDSAVSKTCNVDGSMPWADFKRIYEDAWRAGAKGCTTFNAQGKRFALLTPTEEIKASPAELSCEVNPATGQRSCE